MNFFERRRWRKIVRRALHESRHARHMRMDLSDPADLRAVEEGEGRLQAALSAADRAALESALNDLGERVEHIRPTRPHASWRENVEIIVVALGVAMAFRTYFIQPFKIPTGSMQPTLYGIKVESDHVKSLADVFPLSVVRRLTVGERYVEVRAPASGRIVYLGDYEDAWSVLKAEGKTSFLGIRRILAWIRGNTPPGPVSVYTIGSSFNGSRPVGGRLCFAHREMRMLVREGESVTKGQIIATGLVRSGDHIFVNRLSYNFRRPVRGDVFVFSTRDIQYPGVRSDNYYIKRLVGLPGEKVELDPPYLKIDGDRVSEPFVFRRLVEARDQGYNGYVYPDARVTSAIALGPGKALQLSDRSYLPMGDNTLSSLDGRFFGPVDRTRIVGPAFVVYWPFGPRWGRIE